MGSKWIKISIVYLLTGIAFGLFMHFTLQLQWSATHGHINVVGWLTTGVTGAIYSVYPTAANSIWGKLHFWFYNLGLPLLLIGMFVIQLVVKGEFSPGLMEFSLLLVVYL